MILKLTSNLAILGYLMMSYYFFNEWLEFFLQDEEMNSMNNRFFYGLILVIAAILWPIVVPLAYLELLKFHKRHRKTLDLLRNLFNSRMSDD
ncbi:MAG: hypothetical protein DSM106950_03970 [Stigonema ocellatum SAG 48.90 = DSM 106950]|nr:hypothetical protein [Stigonema ocellatum SAG 48.90 = DSM 106950]